MGIENGVSQQPMCGRTGLSITGIGLEWPDHLMNADELQEYIEKFYSKDEKWYSTFAQGTFLLEADLESGCNN